MSQEGRDAVRKGFSARALTSLTTTIGFVGLAFTGVMLYVSPQGKVAHWTGWTILGLEKDEWSAAHIAFSLLFLIASAFHIYFNWQVLLRYFKNACAKGFASKRELTIALALVGVCFVGAWQGWPPFAQLVAWNDAIKEYWARQSAPPPYPHAEESTLADFARRTHMTIEELVGKLEEAGYAPDDESVTIGDLARQHGATPAQLFGALGLSSRGGQGAGQGRGLGQGQGAGQGSGAGQGRGAGQGQGAGQASGAGQGASPAESAYHTSGQGHGFGQMSLKDYCEQSGIAEQDAVALLKDRGIEAVSQDLLRDVARKTGMRPGELARLLGSAR